VTGPLLDEAYGVSGKAVQVFRNYPIPGKFVNALPAAKAAYCAGQQAPKWFWALYDWLFANQNRWANAKDAADQFRREALSLGADVGKYDTCINDSKTEAAIQRDQQEGQKMGVSATPMFFLVKRDAEGKTITIKGITGALSFEQFDQTLKALLSQ
jgi:protein-disulfide isomerase